MYLEMGLGARRRDAPARGLLRGGLRHSVEHGLNGYQSGFDGSLGCGMALVAGRKGGLVNQQKKSWL